MLVFKLRNWIGLEYECTTRIDGEGLKYSERLTRYAMASFFGVGYVMDRFRTSNILLLLNEIFFWNFYTDLHANLSTCALTHELEYLSISHY
jgi:hypothetical protein